MENLTKQQIILLGLLVSFVTSIATGIVTVSLLDQAPPGVTQTINRVVEKTIERVVQVPTQSVATVVQRETVVVKEDEQTINAIEKNSAGIVRIYREGVTDSNPEPHSILSGMGLVVSKDGFVLTDEFYAGQEKLTGVLADGTKVSLSFASTTTDSRFVLLKAVSDKKDFSFSPVSIGDSNSLKLGQAIVAVGGGVENTVAIGIVSKITRQEVPDAGSTTSPKVIAPVISIDSTISEKNLLVGSPVLSLSGDVVGIRTILDDSLSNGSFSSIVFILKDIEKIQTPTPKTTKK